MFLLLRGVFTSSVAGSSEKMKLKVSDNRVLEEGLDSLGGKETNPNIPILFGLGAGWRGPRFWEVILPWPFRLSSSPVRGRSDAGPGKHRTQDKVPAYHSLFVLFPEMGFPTPTFKYIP